MAEKITKINAREVLDSRGNPTIEVEVFTNYSYGRETVPSGASKGRHEAVELRDGGRRYNGLGVKKAVRNVNEIIARKLVGRRLDSQEEIDRLLIALDGSKQKSRLGANAILGTSMAVAKAASASNNMQLYEYIARISGNNKGYLIPVPFMNIVNGGVHAGNELAFQEYMIVPVAKNFSESLRLGSEVYHQLGKIIESKYGKSSANVGDEGGYAPLINKVRQPLDLIVKAINQLGYQKEVKIAIDAAASQFYGKSKYCVDKKYLQFEALYKLYEKLIDDYPIISLEDPFDEERFDQFKEFNENHNPGIAIIGDDLLATNIERIKKAVEMNACNALLLKINQIGTLTEAIHAGKYAIEHGWDVVISHRSGETESSFIADLAVGLGFGHIKSGAPARGERTAKYNQLLRIEERLGTKALYPKSPFEEISRRKKKRG